MKNYNIPKEVLEELLKVLKDNFYIGDDYYENKEVQDIYYKIEKIKSEQE